MAKLDREQIVEINTRSIMAYGAYSDAIREKVPYGMPLKDVKGNKEMKDDIVAPGEISVSSKDGPIDYYDIVYKRWVDDLTHNESISILQWLYYLEVIFFNNGEFFFEHYKDVFEQFSENQRQRIQFFFPRIDQTTLAAILKICSTSLGQRLSRLAEIGLIARSPLSPPAPKFAWITPQGMGAIEKGAMKASDHMGQLLAHPIPRYLPPQRPAV
ncbi:MAG TPA: hypothetical protein VGG11_14585 [Xanthobacteraceae bacterium]|jgi:hypothetical protein